MYHNILHSIRSGFFFFAGGGANIFSLELDVHGNIQVTISQH